MPVGVYYFPGWSGDLKKWRENYGWNSIKEYPERKPKLGWYDESDPSVINKQADWIAGAGIDYVVFDWYWNERQKSFNTHAVDAFLLRSKKTPGFAFAWANHNDNIRRPDQFEHMVDTILSRYAKDSRYWGIDGKPVIFVVNGQRFIETEDACCKRGSLIGSATKVAKQRGFSGIYFVAGMPATKYWVAQGLAAGFDGFSAYNIRRPIVGKGNESVLPPISYAELTSGYARVWDWMLSQPINYLVPVSAGWDKRPWGGSKRAAEDFSRPVSPQQFERHFDEALTLARSNARAKGVVICCWNEFGEGTYIEPTENDGFEYLDAIKRSVERN